MKSYEGYLPKIPFWTDQQEATFVKSLHQRHYCLFLEPRAGKSKCIVDKTCYHFERKDSLLHINAVLIIAYPNGVHAGWASDAFPENAPDRIDWKALVWQASKCRQQFFRDKFKEMCLHPGLAVFCVNVESTTFDITQKAIVAFLRSRKKVFVVYDESSCLAHENTSRAKVAATIGKRPEVVMSSILDGTPIDAQGPLDLYSQVGWMNYGILGYPNATEFRYHYAEIATKGRALFWSKVREIKNAKIKEGLAAPLAQQVAERIAKSGTVEEDGKRRPMRRGRDWWTEIAKDDDGKPKFRNLDELHNRLDPICSRYTFAECFPSAKTKVYQKRYFELSDEQRRVYEELQREYRTTLGDGTDIEAQHPLTRTLRAQQITSNFYPEQKALFLHEACGGLGCENCQDGIIETTTPMRVIDRANNPRLDALAQELKSGRPAVVWARFRQEVADIYDLSVRLGLNPCKYDGTVGHEGKVDSKEGFQAGRYGMIVGNEGSLSRGIPLFRAELMIGHSNTFSYRMRKQIEERSEHGAKKFATQLIDLVAVDTVDDLCIIPALRSGYDIASFILKDVKKEWI